MNKFIFTFLMGCLIILSACAANSLVAASEQTSFDWKSDWGVEKGFSISIDTEGYHLPTSIAFVPNPGSDPKDPLYFVTEVRGTVKVVTNDRTIYTFAKDFFKLEPKEELPSGLGQVGMAGICLDPKNGFVFATFAYQDQNNILRNNIVRFQTEPETFSLEPAGQIEFTDVFSPYETGLAHHIGPCQVHEDLLYVSVGEAWQPYRTQKLDAMYGKLIRMTLDGKPAPGNPFYEDDDINKVANYVWAYGLRNPFGLKVIGERVFVADNGQNVDRFLEIDKGTNYLWDGNDNSIASNADYVIVPSLGPTQMDYYSQARGFFPAKYDQTFFFGLSAVVRKQGKIPGIMAIPYDLKLNKLPHPPHYLVKYRGPDGQMVTGVAFGPDGLYFSPLLANAEGRSPILKITYNPAAQYPFDLVQTDDPLTLMHEKGCLGCHSIGNDWGFGGVAGPALDQEALVARLDARLNTAAYADYVKDMDSLDTEPQKSYKQARQDVLAVNGIDRVHTWITYRIQEPKFDNVYSQMPNLGVSKEEAEIIARFLTADASQNTGFLAGIRQKLPRPLSYRHIAMAFAAGVLAALGLMVIVRTFMARKKSKMAGENVQAAK